MGSLGGPRDSLWVLCKYMIINSSADNSKNLNKYEFNKAMTDYMLGFSAAENSALFDYFDVDSSGSISYDEFIRAVRGPMN